MSINLIESNPAGLTDLEAHLTGISTTLSSLMITWGLFPWAKYLSKNWSSFL